MQLKGLSEDADGLVSAVLRVNPWLPWWSAEECQEVDEQTKESIAADSVKLLNSKSASDRRRAVEVLARMRDERTLEPLFKAAGDADAEVAGMAVQALDQLRDAAQSLVLTALHGIDHVQWASALRYLAAQPQDLLGTGIPWDWEKRIGFEMVYVPPGPFWMGSDRAQDRDAYDDEIPRHQVALPGYWIAKTPVTVAQFRAFVEAEDYKPEEESLKGGEDHPVVEVSWDDALVYCRWVSKRSGLTVTLPSEAEWEKAARGTDGRLYPWGDAKPDAQHCNFNGNEQGTTPVGRYSPQGDSPYGCVDMVGNMWEWTRSLWGQNEDKPDFRYPYVPRDGREDLTVSGLRILRGGAFGGSGRGARCASRCWVYPYLRSYGVGFRPVLSPYF